MKNNRTTWKYLPLPLVIFLLGSWLAWAQAVKSPQGTAVKQLHHRLNIRRLRLRIPENVRSGRTAAAVTIHPSNFHPGSRERCSVTCAYEPCSARRTNATF